MKKSKLTNPPWNQPLFQLLLSLNENNEPNLAGKTPLAGSPGVPFSSSQPQSTDKKNSDKSRKLKILFPESVTREASSQTHPTLFLSHWCLSILKQKQERT